MIASYYNFARKLLFYCIVLFKNFFHQKINGTQMFLFKYAGKVLTLLNVHFNFKNFHTFQQPYITYHTDILSVNKILKTQ